MTRKEIAKHVYDLWKSNPVDIDFLRHKYDDRMNYILDRYEEYLEYNKLEFSMKYFGYFIADVVGEDDIELAQGSTSLLRNKNNGFIYTYILPRWYINIYSSDLMKILKEYEQKRSSSDILG